jgi:uncharacterized protein (DUF885 family)
MQLTSGSSFHSVLAFLPRTSRFKPLMHYQIILRLEQFPIYFVEQINWMSKSIRTGFVKPTVVLEGFEDSVKSFYISSLRKVFFYSSFINIQKMDIKATQQIS